MKLPKHLTLTLEHNPHKAYYETVQDYVGRDRDLAGDWVSPEEREKAFESQELWTVQWYPQTPVGFNYLQASSLEALLEAIAHT